MDVNAIERPVLNETGEWALTAPRSLRERLRQDWAAGGPQLSPLLAPLETDYSARPQYLQPRACWPAQQKQTREVEHPLGRCIVHSTTLVGSPHADVTIACCRAWRLALTAAQSGLGPIARELPNVLTGYRPRWVGGREGEEGKSAGTRLTGSTKCRPRALRQYGACQLRRYAYSPRISNDRRPFWYKKREVRKRCPCVSNVQLVDGANLKCSVCSRALYGRQSPHQYQEPLQVP